MKSDAESIESYLFDELDEGERANLEERMLSDGEFLERLEFTEDQLTEAYTRDQLSQKDRKRFEAHFMQSPRVREQLALHRALQERLGNKTAAQAPAPGQGSWRSLVAWIGARPFGFAAYAACVALTIVNAGLYWQLEGERVSIERQGAANPRGALTLLPGSMRGTGESVFRLPAGPESVQLQLQPSFAILPGRYSSILKDANGDAVWKSEWTLAGGTGEHLPVAVPGGVLREGNYVLELSRSNESGGSEALADYRFTLKR